MSNPARLVIAFLSVVLLTIGPSGCAVVQGPCSPKSRTVTCVSAAAALAADQCNQDAQTLDISACGPALLAYQACLQSAEVVCQR